MGTALDVDGLLVGTREVYWWAAWSGIGTGITSPSAADRDDATKRGVQVTGFRYRLLDAWSVASQHEHARLRIGWAQYAAGMMMLSVKGLPGVRELLDALEADEADARAIATPPQPGRPVLTVVPRG